MIIQGRGHDPASCFFVLTQFIFPEQMLLFLHLLPRQTGAGYDPVLTILIFIDIFRLFLCQPDFLREFPLHHGVADIQTAFRQGE